MHSAFVGVDGCKGGWLACINIQGQVTFRIEKQLANLVAVLPPQSLMLIDMPIGFADAASPDRQCDKLARAALKPHRTSSVFPVPCRAAVYADSFENACELNRKELGKGLSKQSWAICPKIRELDAVVRSPQHVDMRESHPEVVFAKWQRAPMKAHKATEDGHNQRIAMLQQIAPHLIAVLQDALRTMPRKTASKDDVVDAFALMFAASNPEQLKALPAQQDADESGVSRQIWWAEPIQNTQDDEFQLLYQQFAQQIADAQLQLRNKQFIGKVRDHYGLRWLQLAEDHTMAIFHLLQLPANSPIPDQLTASAMALVRPAFEAAVRGAWALYVASDEELANIEETIHSKDMSLSRLISKLNSHRFAPPSERLNWFAAFAETNKSALHDLTHGGMQQLYRRGDNHVIEPRFPQDEINRLLRVAMVMHKKIHEYVLEWFGN